MNSANTLLVPLDDARAMLGGIARQTLYNLLREGVIETVMIGKRRMVVVASLERYVEGQKSSSYTSDALPVEGRG